MFECSASPSDLYR